MQFLAGAVSIIYMEYPLFLLNEIEIIMQHFLDKTV